MEKEKMNKTKNFLPLVSIAIPVYNGAEYMREAIDSALSQTYKNIEIIVINDGSTDNTDEIAESYGRKIRYFKKENGGVASALNLALKNMKGSYFAWLSHDDAYYPNKVEKQMECITSLKEGNNILYSDYALMDEESNIKSIVKLDHKLLKEKLEYALLRGSINGNTLLIPKKAFDEYGGFDEGLSTTQDYAKWFEFLKSYRFIHIPEVWVKYRVHQGQDTKQNPKFVTEGNMLWIRMMKDLPQSTKERLEGNEQNFYREMFVFLNRTPYKEAAEYAKKSYFATIKAKIKKEELFVLFVAHSSNVEGAERAMINSIDGLLEKKVYTYVVLPSPGPIEKLLQKRKIDYSIQKLNLSLKVKGMRDEYVKARIYKDSIELCNLLENIKPDVVVSISSVIYEGALAAKKLSIPHVWTISEYGREEHGIKYFTPEKERLQFIKDYSDKIFFVSETLKNHFLGEINLENTVIFPPISRKEIGLKKKNNNIYFKAKNGLKITLVGNIHHGKGQKDAVFAASELFKKGLGNFEIIIVGPVGDPNYEKELKEIIKYRGLEGKVRILPALEDVIDLFSEADIVLNCSVYESFGRVTAEAMLCKKPVIAANSGATPELVKDDETGFLYHPGNFTDLAGKIEYFYKNRAKIREFGERGYSFITKKLDDKKLTDEYYNELKELKGKKSKNKKRENEIVEELKYAYNKNKKSLEKEEIIYNENLINKASFIVKTRGVVGTLLTAKRVIKKRLTKQVK